MPLKRFYRLQRTRLTAAPLILRPAPSWRIRVFGLIVSAAILLTFGVWLGWRESDAVHCARFSGQTDRIEYLDKKLISETAARKLAEQKLVVEQTTRKMLAQELERTQSEATARQESLVFLDSLLTTSDRSRAVRFVACELQVLDTHKYRYRALVAQGLNDAAEFSGRLLVNVDYLRHGQRTKFILGDNKNIPVRIRHYERMEGELALPADAVPLSLDIRVISLDGRQTIAQCQKKT